MPRKKKSRSGPSLSASQRRANGLELLQGLWLPAELVARLRGACERLGVTKTKAVGEALAGWLAKRPDHSYDGSRKRSDNQHGG